MSLVQTYTAKLAESLKRLPQNEIAEAADMIAKARRVFVMGNGGSATTAQHFAQGLRDAGVKAFSLVDNVGIVTALANDYGYEQVFERQLAGIAGAGDMVVVISASGDSENVVRGVRCAKSMGLVAVGLFGFSGGVLRDIVDKYVLVDDDHYGRVEDAHLAVCHMICELVGE